MNFTRMKTIFILLQSKIILIRYCECELLDKLKSLSNFSEKIAADILQ